MNYAIEFARKAQRWHDTDHGKDRGKPLRRTKFIEPVDDEGQLIEVPEGFRECRWCDPAQGWTERNNPFWFRVIAWESGQGVATV